MSLMNTGHLLQTACEAGYCVGAFNIVDYLTLEAVIHSAETRHAPVIIQTSTSTVRRFSARRLVALTRTLADTAPVPVGLHLDHGTEWDVIQECIEAGYTSVMIDASRYPFEENIARTKKVVDAAHARGIAVEGEIGVMAGVEDDLVVHQDDAIYTTPAEAIEFQARAGVDFLAVAIGTAHGFYKVEPRLDIDTLRTLRGQVHFPMVVHGGTGLSMDTLRALVAAGASKLNVSTQLKKTYIDSLETFINAHKGEYNPVKMLEYATEQLSSTVCAYLDVLGCSGRI